MEYCIEITQEQLDIDTDDYFWRVELMDKGTKIRSASNSALFTGYLNGRDDLVKTMIETTEKLDEHLKNFHRAG